MEKQMFGSEAIIGKLRLKLIKAPIERNEINMKQLYKIFGSRQRFEHSNECFIWLKFDLKTIQSNLENSEYSESFRKIFLSKKLIKKLLQRCGKKNSQKLR